MLIIKLSQIALNKMSRFNVDVYPVITIQSDWNEALRLPNGKVWISAKYINMQSCHDTITTAVNKNEGKIKVNVSEEYNLCSHSNLCLVLKHLKSGLKVAFVAATKVHNIHKKAMLSVSTAETGLTVSSCDEDKLLIWDSRTDEQLLDLKGHGGPVYRCRFFPSGTVVISAGADGSCRIWSAESGVNPVTLKGHSMSVADICIVDKGRNIISVSKDGTAKLWDVGESNCLDNIIQGQGPINCCSITSTSDEVIVENEREIGTGNKTLVVGCESGIVIGAHVAKREQKFVKQLDAACNSCIILKELVIVGCSNGKIIHLDLNNGSHVIEIHESASPVLSLAPLVNDMYVVGRQDGSCTVMSINEQYSSVRAQLTGSDCDGIRDICFNGKWIFAACRDSNVRKYDFNQISVHFK